MREVTTRGRSRRAPLAAPGETFFHGGSGRSSYGGVTTKRRRLRRSLESMQTRVGFSWVLFSRCATTRRRDDATTRRRDDATTRRRDDPRTVCCVLRWRCATFQRSTRTTQTRLSGRRRRPSRRTRTTCRTPRYVLCAKKQKAHAACAREKKARFRAHGLSRPANQRAGESRRGRASSDRPRLTRPESRGCAVALVRRRQPSLSLSESRTAALAPFRAPRPISSSSSSLSSSS